MWWWIAAIVAIGVGLIALMWSAFTVGARDDELMERYMEKYREHEENRWLEDREDDEHDGA